MRDTGSEGSRRPGGGADVTGQTIRVAYLVVSAAPPLLEIQDLINPMRSDGWDVHIIATPTAATWIDLEPLGDLTGHKPLSRQRLPHEPSALPPAHAIIAAPATFNLINKWAAGINDNLAVGVLNEALGIGVPIIAAPHAKTALATHPAFINSLRVLISCGVTMTATEALRPTGPGEPYQWQTVLAEIRRV